MFPVCMVLCHLEGTPRYLESEVQDLFAEDVARLGGGTYRGWITMTAGPIGTGSFYQYFLQPKTALDLALLVEYSEDCHHGFAVIVMRKPEKSFITPSPLAMVEHGGWLDALPPSSTIPLNAVANPSDAEWQTNMVEDWNRSKEYIEQLELENRMLRARLNS